MHLQKLCSVLIILLLSTPIKSIHASSDPRIVATYLNWEISLFYDQNVKSCVAISKGNYYEHREEKVVEEIIEEEAPVAEEASIEEDDTMEFDTIEKPVNIGAYDYGVDGDPRSNRNSSTYDFGQFNDDLIVAKSIDDETSDEDPATITSQAEQETINVDNDPNIIPQSEQTAQEEIAQEEAAQEEEAQEEIAQEEEAQEEVAKIDTDKILAEARAEYEGKQSAAAKNIQKGAFLITSWPKRSEYFDISIRPQALLQTDKTSWLIFPDNSRFVLTQSKLDAKPNPYLRAEIIKRLRENRFAEVVNYNQDGDQLRYYYDLRGIDHALSALIKFCPLPHYPE